MGCSAFAARQRTAEREGPGLHSGSHCNKISCRVVAMQPQNGTPNRMSSQLGRREFVLGSLGAFTIVPRRVLGGAGYVAPSDKINIAFIGTGSQGLRVMLDFLTQPDVQAVAVCDPNRSSDDYPQWSPNEFASRVSKLLGGRDEPWIRALSTDRKIQLTRRLVATAGVAGREPCQKIVNAYYGLQTRSGNYDGCKAYEDFRELLEKESDVDAVVVGTTDHLHAAVSIAAMRKGKHVFCQKPMTQNVWEARRMAEVAHETGVATQVAVGNQASEDTRLLCEWIWAGAIGKVRLVVNWSARPYWPQGLDRPTETPPVPEGLNWDLWLGPAPWRPYHPLYLPFNWRGWYDFGSGAIGDMGCYSFDTIFRVLRLEAPEVVEASSTELYEESYPKACLMRWKFGARGDMPPVEIHWYDGGLKPPYIEELEGKPMPEEGLLFVGDEGKILCQFHGRNPRLLPEARMKSFTPPPKTLPRSPGNEREWLNACKGAKEPCGANFIFTAKVTETILLGNVALRAGGRIRWDPARFAVPGHDSAKQLLQPPRREGWEL